MADPEALLLPFPEAIETLRSKLAIPTQRWDELAGQLNEVAFTVAQITSLRLLQEIQDLVVRQLEDGVDVDSFKTSFSTLLADQGLSMPGYRAELVISQNLRNAYGAGRYAQLTDPDLAQNTGAFEWRHRDSPMFRPNHKALDGKLLDPNSDFWQQGGFPPCGFGCRCGVFRITKRQLGNRKPEQPPPVETIADKGFRHAPVLDAELRSQLVSQAKASLSPEFAALLEDVEFAEALQAAIEGTLDFAAKKQSKGPNCTTGKSHFCRRPNGRGSCITVKKQCRYKPDGTVKTAADYVGKQKQYKNAQALDKAAKQSKGKNKSANAGKEPNKGSTGEFTHTIVGSKQITSAQLNNAINQLPEESRELVKDFIARNDIRVALHTKTPISRNGKRKLAPNLSDDEADEKFQKLDAWVMGKTSFVHNVINLNLEANAFREKPDFSKIKKVKQNSLDDIDIKAMQQDVRKELDIAKKALNVDEFVDNIGFDFADNRASRIFTTYLHELGHQVQFAEGAKDIFKPFVGKSVSAYATENTLERFAEAFATWAINPVEYRKFDPAGANQIEAAIKLTRKHFTI